MKNREDTQYFDSLVSERLGHYVYILIDPETKQPFYVGKGGGKQGRGNQRLLAHFEEARATEQGTSKKITRIHEIWARGRDVSWKIVRHSLPTEESAFSVECALIDLLNEIGPPLANAQSGHGKKNFGIKTPKDLRTWAAPLIEPSQVPEKFKDRPIYLFNIVKGLKSRRLHDYPDEYSRLLEATCRYWKGRGSALSSKNAIAIGCVDGVSRIAVDVLEWVKNDNSDRYEIIPSRTSEDAAHNELMYKNFNPIIQQAKGYWQRGNYIGFKFIDTDAIQMILGSKIKQPICVSGETIVQSTN